MNKAYKQYFDLIFGSTLLTLGIYLFVTPNGINFGGVIGLAQIIEIFLRRFIAIRSDANLVGMINFLINVPLFLIGYRVMSRRFCIKTMLSVAVQTLLLSVLPPLKAPLVEDVLLNCIFGAILCGVGVGYALRGSGFYLRALQRRPAKRRFHRCFPKSIQRFYNRRCWDKALL